MRLITKIAALVVAVLTLALVGVAPAADKAVEREYRDTYDQVVKEKAGPYEKGYPGRDILRYGVNDKSERPPTTAELKDAIGVMDRMLNPPVYVAPEPTYTEPTTSYAPTTSGTGWSSVVQCESGGDYSINTGNGYYGAYQFDSQTWDAYGDPAYGEANEAPPAVQDAAAASVPYDAWPNC